MKEKKLVIKTSLIIVALLIVIAAFIKFGQNKEKKVVGQKVEDKKTDTIKFSGKDTKYKTDNTTEVLVDKTFKKEDIVKSVKHGDHWHVWTKDGREHITYTSPDEMNDDSDIQLVDVISLDKLKGEKVKEIKVHGDHWHVFTEDGREFLTYEDPIKLFSNIKIGKYTGSHGNTAHKSGETKNVSNSDVVKILKHGDHYHIYTKDGSEFISYVDPRSKYPNAEFGTYKGNHGDIITLSSKISIPKKGNEISNSNYDAWKKEVNKLNIIKVLGQKEVDRFDIVKILKHGDHYHLYDSKGNEGLAYANPKALYPDAIVGVYSGNHGSANNHKNPSKDKNTNVTVSNNDSGNEVVKILKHGDHYHVYTKDGSEFISYENPRSKYPKAEYGIYTGSHGDNTKKIPSKETPKPGNNSSKPGDKTPKPGKNNSVDAWREEVAKLNIIKVLGQKEVDRYDIVKILKHEDHYHLYDSKGNEGLTYTNPKALYPKATFGEYTGNHGDNNSGKQPGKEEVKWPKGVDRIVEHGDHYHIYIGDKEVGLVHEDPRPHYPNAVFEEDLTKRGSKVEVKDSEIFTYDSIEAKLYKEVLPYLSSHIKNVTNFGELKTNLAIAGSDGATKDIFYWNHGNHYHAITIKQLVQLEKIGTFGEHTAKEVASSLKYAIKNKTTLSKIDEENTVNPTIRQIADFIKNHYKIDEEDMSIGESFVEIPLGEDYAYFEIIQFELKDGKVVPRIEMPTAESIAKEQEGVYGSEDEEDEEVEETEEA